MAHLQTQTEWEEEMSGKILTFVRRELYLDLRYMEPALSAFTYRKIDGLPAFSTDGVCLYFSAEWVLRVFQKNSGFLNRAYLHTVLHCLFRQLWQMGKRDRRLWNIACDIAVEYTIDSLDKACTKRILSWIRTETYDSLKKEETGISAAIIYRRLDTCSTEKIEALEREFYTDSHRFWPKEEDMQSPFFAQAKQNWDKAARQVTLEKNRRGEDREEGEKLLAAQVKAQESRRSYREFLQKFAVLLEEPQLDLEEFDLGYYSYGLRLYGNLPLIEPLETKEVNKIREFVIVIDTSYSTSQTLVEKFLKETYTILTQKNNFSLKCSIRILQCDEKVQKDDRILSLEELEQFMADFEIVGGGGTDFRPAFAYIGELMAKGVCRPPSGLLYFTDGKGVYPKQKPEYKTAFLFLEEYDETAVPPWAMRLKLESEEFLHEY